MTKSPEAAAVRRAILRWYGRHGRPFPWRDTRDPYRILVSEIMLQQTQAGRVASRFPAFIEEYPDVQSLANATRAEVLRAWRGMGYNNRAVRLHGAVKDVVAMYGGRLPRETGELAALPGIGKYTAHAVACFAHGRRVPVVDVNVRRVLSRIFGRMGTPASLLSDRTSWELAAEVLPANAYDWNQALMDFGAAVCTARAPKCASCAVSRQCLSATFLGGTGGGRRPAAPATPGDPVPGRVPAGAGRKAGPSHRGIPRRFWRGSVVEALRASDGSLSISELGRRARPSGRRASSGWIREIVSRLEKDGIVEVSRRGRRISVFLAS